MLQTPVEEAASPSLAFHPSSHGDSYPLTPSSRPQRAIRRPFRFPSYPRIVTLQRRNGHEESYCRSLLLAGHGFPMWKPSGNLAMPVEYLTKGVNIGDVGVIDNDGFFRCYFNVFLPRDHPIHRGFVPREFQPIEPPLCADEVVYKQQYFKPGHIVASKGVVIKRHSENPLDISFTSTEPEGGILILPAGASREDLVSTDRFHEYVRKNGPHWYQYINHYSYTTHPNGCLFLVTGYDKARDWAIASFPYRSGNTEDKLDLRYKWKPEYRPPWIDPGTAETDFFAPSRKIHDHYKEENQCVFLRGLRISLTQQSWQNTLPYMEEAKRHYSFILSTPSSLQTRLHTVLVFLRLRLSEKRAVGVVKGANQV
ncbi:hypothetical protein CPB84DRAFT_1678554 [Gymnopilus junonius]|uniref:Uncharacterized protein n=1 Tax=Gymnopilus junonius TaxID=109634 RepID=A0A9P5TQ12_GYMJU|nr:hypothetical protein CPB84DRAFT_1678554 [Gymnopilus junonius]